MVWTPRFTAALLLATGLVAGCATAPRTREGKDELVRHAAAALKEMDAEFPGVESLARWSDGYAMFPSVGKAGIGIGGAYGRGVVYADGRHIGYADVAHASLGAQLGGQAYQALVVFDSKETVERFKGGRLEFSVDSSGVLFTSGHAAHVRFLQGVMMFMRPVGGAMASASMGAVRFTFVPANDEVARPAPSPGTR